MAVDAVRRNRKAFVISRAGLSGVEVVGGDDILGKYDEIYIEGCCRVGENDMYWTFGLNELQGCLPSHMRWQVRKANVESFLSGSHSQHLFRYLQHPVPLS